MYDFLHKQAVTASYGSALYLAYEKWPPRHMTGLAQLLPLILGLFLLYVYQKVPLSCSKF